MSIDFFKNVCQDTTVAVKFGLFDAEDNSPAVIKFVDEDTWNAIVLNNQAHQVNFTAIDNCIEIFRENGEMESRCDVMIQANQQIILVELKNKRDSWQAEGIAQIEAIIKILLKQNEDFYFGFTKRLAVVANTKHRFPSFQSGNIEQREFFMKEYKTRVQFDGIIKLK